MTGDKSLALLEEAKRHRKKAAEMRALARAAASQFLREMYEDIARSHETLADDNEGQLSPGETRKT